MTYRPSGKRPMLGWREWLALPELGVEELKAKLDTGARSSALHAFDIDVFHIGKRERVRFGIHPLQRCGDRAIVAEAEVIDYRMVRTSGGHTTRRPVILTTVTLFGEDWPIELTLADRDAMGFRMLLGRQGLRGRFLVDPAKSFVAGKRHEARNGEA